MFLSVIIPVYNSEKYLSRCFDDILKQRFTDFEVIVIDDGSKDKSPEICDRYAEKDGRIAVFHIENGGPSRARNIGFKKAQGRYVYCVDNDDEIKTDTYFTKIYEELSNNPAEILLTGASYQNDKREEYAKVINYNNLNLKENPAPEDIAEVLIGSKQYETSCWTKIIDREFLINNELFFDENLLVEDLDWNMRFFKVLKKFSLLRCDDYVHYFRSGSISSAKGERAYKNTLDQINVIKKWSDYYINSCENRKLKNSLLSFLSYQFLITMAMASFFEEEKYKEIKAKLKEIDYVTKYALEKKQKILTVIYRVLGYNVTEKLVNYYYRNQTTRAKK